MTSQRLFRRSVDPWADSSYRLLQQTPASLGQPNSFAQGPYQSPNTTHHQPPRPGQSAARHALSPFGPEALAEIKAHLEAVKLGFAARSSGNGFVSRSLEYAVKFSLRLVTSVCFRRFARTRRVRGIIHRSSRLTTSKRMQVCIGKS